MHIIRCDESTLSEAFQTYLLPHLDLYVPCLEFPGHCGRKLAREPRPFVVARRP